MKMLKRFYSLAAAVTLVFSLGISAQVHAVKYIEIDTKNLGPRVSHSMFGANKVFTWNNFVQMDKTLSYLDQNTVRYPGGSVTENQFNPNNPFVYLNGNSVPKNKDIRSYIARVNQHNWHAVFVVPTARYVNNPNRAAYELERFALRLLRGDFGLIENGRTVHFEVGNEFYWRKDITADQYGVVASRAVKAIRSGIKKSGKAANYRTEISVQSGNTPAQAQTVARYFKGLGSYVNYFTFHWYPGRTEIQLGMWRMDGVSQKFSARLNSVAAKWRQVAGFSRPFFMSEYNIRQRLNSNFDLGLRNPMGLMSIFAESVRGNARMATVWPLMAWRTNLPTKLFRTDSGNTVLPTTLGKFSRWMRGSLAGSRIVNGITNNTFSNASQFRNQGVYVEAFRRGSNRLTVFVFGTETAKTQVRLNFKNFSIDKVRADRLYTARGQESNPNVVASNGRLWPSVWGWRKDNATFTLNKSSKYEVVKLEFVGKFK